MATSEVQICSNALLMLGADPIASFDEAVTGATLSKNLWPTVRDAVLRSHPWNVATVRQVIAYEGTTPAYDWAYSYLLPAECLRVLAVGQYEDGDADYQVENGRIYSDDALVYLRYITRLEDVTKYDALLTLAMTSGMAAMLAYPITKSASMQKAMTDLHLTHLRTARSVNGMEDPPEEFAFHSRQIAARG